MAYWAKTYGPGEAKAVAVDRDGDIIVVGEREGDGFVARLDRDGNVKWFKTYGGDKDDVFNDVKIAPNGDIIVAGYTESFGVGGRSVWVLRLDEEGNVKWQKTYGGKYSDGASSVAISSNGDIIVAGYTWSFGAGWSDFWVLRLDENGNLKWQKTYGGEWDERAETVAIAPNGDIIVAGYTESFGTEGRNVWVLRLDENGNVKWQRIYKGNYYSEALMVSIAKNNDTTVAGYTKGLNTSSHDVWVLKLDENGNIKWQKTYSGNKDDIANAVTIAENGDVIVAGGTKSFGMGSYDVWVLRLDENGNVKWQKTYGGSSSDHANAVAIAPNGDIIISGCTKSFGMGSYEVWVLRLPSNGELPNCDFCMDSNAQIIETNAKVLETTCEVLSGVKKGLLGKLIKKELVSKSSSARINEISVKPQIQYYLDLELKHSLQDFLTLSIPQLIEGTDSIIKFSVKNDFTNSLKLTLDLSENDFLDFETTSLEFPELKKDQEVSKSLTVTPKHAGNFDFRIKVRAIVDGIELETEKVIPIKIKEHPAKRRLKECVELSTSDLIEEIPSTIEAQVDNTVAGTLKLILDFSDNDFFDFETTTLEFPELKKGQKISKSLAVTPKYAGSFDFRVKIKAIADGIEFETEKVIPVEVAEKTTTPAHPTPRTPATPVTPVTPTLQAVTPTPALQPATPITPSPSYPVLRSFPAELLSIYEPLEELGRGGFARVFKAKRKKDGEIVAVKVPLSLDPVTGKSFLREIENWVHLKHPNIVKVYDYNILPVPFFEMEYCESSLERLPVPINPKEAALLVFNIAEGLKYAHSKGIIHRDLKPSNILLKQGIPKISDWGLSKVLGKSGTTTTSFTALYAAPEQFSRSRFGPTDERTDIWQLGVIFYQLVTGKLPFDSEDPFELMFLIMNEEPLKPSELNPEAKEVEPIILRMIAKRKEDRYESAVELQSDLASYLGIEFRRELKRSRTMGDKRLVVYYLGNLLIMSVKMGNLSGAYKYASDFAMLTSGELKEEFESLASQFKLRLEEGLEIPVELIEKTDVLVHRAMVLAR